MKVVQVSESEFTVQGHGVHTAFVETVRGLRKHGEVTLETNVKEPADIRHIHTVGPYALRQLLFGAGKKVVSAHIVPDSLVGSLRGAHLWKGLAKVYLRFFYNRADAVIAVSDATKEVLVTMGVKKPITVIYNMIDMSLYRATAAERKRARHAFGYTEKDWIVVSNGQVQPRKRIDTFIRLATALPDMQFIWVGGIPFKGAAANYEQMKKLIKQAPKNVRFTGVVKLDDVKQYFHAADVFIMPSDQETFGLAIVEAAASGLPLVLRDIHDYDQTFRPDALMGNDETFAALLQRLRSEPKLYKEMVAKAATLAERYDCTTVTDELVALYKSLLD